MADRKKEIFNYVLRGAELAEAKRTAALYQKLTGDAGFVKRVNEQSIQWMKGRAVGNLEKSITANHRPQIARRDQNNKSLRQVIFNDDSHKVTPFGWKFMVESQVRPQKRGGDYAFSLEYGDSSQIGRDIYFLFLGRTPNERRRGINRSKNPDPDSAINRHGDKFGDFTFNHRPSIARSNNRRVPFAEGVQRLGPNSRTDRIMGPRELGRTDAPKLKGRQFRQPRFKVTIRNPVPEWEYGRKAGRDFKKFGVYGTLAVAEFKKHLEKETHTELVVGPKTKKPRRARTVDPLKGRNGNGDVTVIPGSRG